MQQISVKKKTIFLILFGYQITWIACVIGEYKGLSNLGIIIGLIYLSLYFYFTVNKAKAFKICLKYSLIGILFDSILSYSELLVITSNLKLGFIPIWLVVLWLSFSTLFVDVLSFLRKKPILSILCGSILAPPTYYIGIILNIATSNNIVLAIPIMAIFWGSLLYYYSLSAYK